MREGAWQLPPAEAYRAVYRTDAEGCLEPLLARDLRRPLKRLGRIAMRGKSA